MSEDKAVTMKIVGIGLDATEIDRIERTIERYGDRFLKRVFTEDEIAYCARHRRPGPSLAARFAAKEAAMKALGTGVSMGVVWRDVEVFRRHGPPQLRFHGVAAERFRALGATGAFLTLTHAQTLALAQVILIAGD
jgi:holo-[acyl-carrier protein] synthase